MAKVIALELEKNYLLLVLLDSDFHSALIPLLCFRMLNEFFNREDICKLIG